VKPKRLRVVSNSGPLIHLAKIGALWLLEELFEEILIPIEVERETVNTGIELGYDDAKIIGEAIERGKIKVVEYKAHNLSLAEKYGVERGEYLAMMLAIEENCVFLCDDERARELGERKGLEVRGSIGIILMALKNNLITREQAVRYIEKLKKVMYFSEKLFERVKKMLENI